MALAATFLTYCNEETYEIAIIEFFFTFELASRERSGTLPMRNPQEICLLLEENIAQESWSLHLHLLLGALVAPLHTPCPPGVRRLDGTDPSGRRDGSRGASGERV